MKMEGILSKLDLSFLRLDISTKNTFLELLIYHIKNKIPLSFQKFNTFAGISKLQWDDFRFKYKELLQFV